MDSSDTILPGAEPTRIIIDTDPGIDDVAAILMGLGSQELQVEALTTIFGNATVSQSTVNALRLLEAAGRTDIPVYQGVGKCYNFTQPAYSAQVHGSDGFGDIAWPLPTTPPRHRHAVLEIIDRVLSAPGEITVVALGRLTNLALAISLEPRVATALRSLIVMGGAITVPGNTTPVASANVWGDPEAADVVYRSGAKIVQIGLDVCDQVEISAAQQRHVWQANTAATRLLQALTPCLQASYKRRGLLRQPDSIRYNDVPAMAYVIDASLFACRDVYVRIETQGHLTRGQTVADLRGQGSAPPNVTVAFGVDAPRLTHLWVERVSHLRC
ncbi:MAG TPA: nucleoside hydrolase [Candidatus Tectomicrobia bacterium]|nr:nucleoside hydrolase [Candidatus Tectomicrobia bacterium]